MWLHRRNKQHQALEEPYRKPVFQHACESDVLIDTYEVYRLSKWIHINPQKESPFTYLATLEVNIFP